MRILLVFDPARQAVLLVAGGEGLTMARNWKDVRAQAVDAGLLDDARVSELRARLRAGVRTYRLAEIRQAYGLDQGALAERLGVSQSRISRIERGDLDHSEIGTVRGYVHALGGEVEIVARFGDERITVG